VPFRIIQKDHATCRFRAQAQGRKVNTFIKRQLLLKMLFYSKKLCASAPLREITVPTPVNRTTPITTCFPRRAAGAQSEHIHQETSSPKMLFHCKKLRASAPLREITVPAPSTARPPARRIFRAESFSGRPFTQRVIPVSFASESSALQRLCGRLHRGVLVRLWFRVRQAIL
jgi:hypothetical protein